MCQGSDKFLDIVMLTLIYAIHVVHKHFVVLVFSAVKMCYKMVRSNIRDVIHFTGPPWIFSPLEVTNQLCPYHVSCIMSLSSI